MNIVAKFENLKKTVSDSVNSAAWFYFPFLFMKHVWLCITDEKEIRVWSRNYLAGEQVSSSNAPRRNNNETSI